MSVTVVGGSAAVAAGGAGSGDISVTPTLPAGTVDGHRVFIFATGRNSLATPAGWTDFGFTGASGGGSYGVGTGPRSMQVFYRDKDASWSAMPTITSAGFPGIQNAVVAGAVTVSKAANESWTSPVISTYANDTTSNTSLAGTAVSALPVSTGDVVFLFDGFPGLTTTASPTLTVPGLTAGTVTSRIASAGTASGDQVAEAVYSAQPTGSSAATSMTHGATLGTARTAGIGFIVASARVMPKVGASNISRLYLGSSPAAAVYLGSNRVL